MSDLTGVPPENENDKALAIIEQRGTEVVREYVERGRPLPDLLDLEVALAGLPKVNEWLKRAMAFKGRAEMVVEDYLKSIEGKQRLYGATAFGLKDGGWTMAPADAETLLRFLTTYVGTDYTQAQLDAGIRKEGVRIKATCPDHGEFDVPVVCRRCGVTAETMVVNHTGLNKIEKVARADVKKRLDGTSPETLRRRYAPSLTLTPAR